MNTAKRAAQTGSSAHLHPRRRRWLTDLKDFIRFPTVSAQPKHTDDVKRCASWLAEHLQSVGLERVQILPTPRHPIVYAEWLRAPGKPTVLIYGHYDVQPAEPFAEWRTPPFEPTVVGDDLFGRGACDDKGQMLAHVKAIDSCLKTQGRLPVNVKCLFEGEEEIGSPNLKPFVERNRRRLAADVAVMSDTRMLAADQPALTYALRGGLSFELEVAGRRAICIPAISGGRSIIRCRRSARLSPSYTAPTVASPFRAFMIACGDGAAPSANLWPRMVTAMNKFCATPRPSSAGASAAIRCTSGRRSVPRSASRALPAVIKAKASKPSSRRSPPPNSTSGSCPIKTRWRSNGSSDHTSPASRRRPFGRRCAAFLPRGRR